MGWDLGLLLSTGLCVGIAIDSLARPRRPGLTSVLLLAVCGALWSGGELLLHHAGSAEEMLAPRRILFAGVCALGPVLLWTAGHLHGPSLRRLCTGIAVAGGILELGLYTSFYGSDHDLFISGEPANPARGPLFFVHGATQWGLLSLGLLLFAAAAQRVRTRRRATGWIVVAGICLPLLVNWLYVGLDLAPRDPTPLAMGVTAATLRWGVLEMVGAPFLASLARSELLDQLDAAVLVADGRGRVLELNHTGHELLGGSDPTGAELGFLLEPFERDPGYDVRRFPLERHGLRVGEGVIVTDRRQAREAERRTDVATRLEALGLLSQGLAHEINNPLTSVLVSTDFLGEHVRRSVRDPHRWEEMEALLDTIASESMRIAEIVRRLEKLAVLPPNDGAPGRADVSAVAHRVVGLTRIGKDRRRIRMELPNPPVEAAIRPEELLQVLLQLVSNALESDERGHPVEVQVDPDDVQVVVEVQDRGTGFADVDPSRIFDPFYTTKRPDRGVGLGLSLCWEIARQNGGRLEALAREGGGARLRLTLPRA